MGKTGTGPFSGNSDLHQGQMIGGMRFIGWNSFVGRNWTYFAPYLLKEPRNEKSKKKIFGEGWSHPDTGREETPFYPGCKKISSLFETHFLGWHSAPNPTALAQCGHL